MTTTRKTREVMFLSQSMAEALLPEGTESIISVTDRGANPADLQDGWKRVLRIQFNDVDPDEDSEPETEIERGELTDEQAEQIAQFVALAVQDSPAIIVHCRFGQSRSPAIAETYGLPFPAEFNTHNRFVQRLVFEALSRGSVA